MKRKTIAVDLDDVLADSAAKFVAFSNEQWGTNLEVDDYSEHWAEMWGVDIEEALKRREHIYKEAIQINLEAFSGVKEILTELGERFDLIIVTSRPLVLQKGTIQWLEQYYGGLFKDIHFAGIWDGKHDVDVANLMTKASLIKELGADYFIDDHPKHCFAVAAEGIPAVLFGDYSWNRDLKLPAGVTRAKDWKAVKEYFDEQS